MKEVQRMKDKLPKLLAQLRDKERNTWADQQQCQSLAEAQIPSSVLKQSTTKSGPAVDFNMNTTAASMSSISPNLLGNEVSPTCVQNSNSNAFGGHSNTGDKRFKCPVPGCGTFHTVNEFTTCALNAFSAVRC